MVARNATSKGISLKKVGDQFVESYRQEVAAKAPSTVLDRVAKLAARDEFAAAGALFLAKCDEIASANALVREVMDRGAKLTQETEKASREPRAGGAKRRER